MKLRTLAVALITPTLPLAIHAQSGCVDSPENPTALLALVGAAAANLRPRRRR